MHQLQTLVKSVLPARIRPYLRAAHRDFVFRRAMKRFLKNPESCTHAENPLFLDLIYGWGNERWSGLGEYLSGCIYHALISRGPILECGSGLSTILVGAVAKRQGYSHWALEHKPYWASKVQSYLNMYQLDSVILQTIPLKDYGDFCWYEAPSGSMPDSFSLVVCDGPPGSTKGGRYGLVPVMRDRLKPGCVILLDDAGREQELATARRWSNELGATVEVHGSIKPYIEMKVSIEMNNSFLPRLKAIGRFIGLNKLVHALRNKGPTIIFKIESLFRRPYGARQEIKVHGKPGIYDVFPCRTGQYICVVGYYGRLSPAAISCRFASGEWSPAQLIDDGPDEIEGQQVLILLFAIPDSVRATGHTRITLENDHDILLKDYDIRLYEDGQTNALAITTMIKDDDRLLNEWMEYHRLLGADHFYIYDNLSLKRNKIRKLLAPYIKSGLVTLIDWDYPKYKNYQTYSLADISNRFCQRGQMHHCLYKYGDRSKWMLFIDVDEFIFPVNGEDSLLPLLQRYEGDLSVAALEFKMIWFGNSGHREVPPGLVLENYTRRAESVLEQGQEKCVVKPELVETLFVHHVKTHAPGARIISVPSDQYRINHYFSLSPRRRKLQSPEHNDVEDKGMARFAPRVEQAIKAIRH